MPRLDLLVTVVGMGGLISQRTARMGDGGSVNEISVPAGAGAGITNRTSDTVGTLLMGSVNHGITTGQKVDVYWNGGVQYDVTVGTVSGTSVPISSGSGDALPNVLTPVVVSPVVVFSAAVDGDEIALLAMQQNFANQNVASKSHVQFLDSGSAEIAEIDLEAHTPRIYDIVGGDTNPFIGNPISSGAISNGSNTDAATFKMLWVQDSTP